MVQNISETENRLPATSGRGFTDPHVDMYAPAYRDVHPQWRSLFAGIFIALSTLTVLSLLGVGIGAAVYDRNTDMRSMGMGAGIWGILSSLIAFFVGGYAAARIAAIDHCRHGLLHGMLVWAVAVPLLAIFVGSGITRMGVAGLDNNTNTYVNTNANSGFNAAGVPSDNTTAAENAAEAKRATMKAAWGSLISLLLGFGAACLGGYMGPRSAESGTTVAAGTTSRTITEPQHSV